LLIITYIEKHCTGPFKYLNIYPVSIASLCPSFLRF